MRSETTNHEEAVFRALIPALDGLPDVMRILLLLHLYDGIRTVELSVMLDCDIRIVRSLRERAFRLLEKQLAAKQLAIERSALPSCIRKAYGAWIEEQEPDPDSVVRIRSYLTQLAAG